MPHSHDFSISRKARQMAEQYKSIPLKDGKLYLMAIPQTASQAGLSQEQLIILELSERVEELQKLVMTGLRLASHQSGCAHTYGHDCDCGYDEFKNITL